MMDHDSPLRGASVMAPTPDATVAMVNSTPELQPTPQNGLQEMLNSGTQQPSPSPSLAPSQTAQANPQMTTNDQIQTQTYQTSMPTTPYQATEQRSSI